uniref:Putative secreted protein n=1 Tax=Ixodes ricinus TaxID=34613 RepID=A0A6B0TVH4_IXORI
MHVRMMKPSLVVFALSSSLVFCITIEQNSRKVTRRLDGGWSIVFTSTGARSWGECSVVERGALLGAEEVEHDSV